MEYDDKNKPSNDTALLKMLIDTMIERQNEQSQTIAELRSQLADVTLRMDEATHMTSDDYGQQVVQQIMAAMPAIQAEAIKAAKRGGRR